MCHAISSSPTRILSAMFSITNHWREPLMWVPRGPAGAAGAPIMRLRGERCVHAAAHGAVVAVTLS
jgi:hypothetical protein